MQKFRMCFCFVLLEEPYTSFDLSVVYLWSLTPELFQGRRSDQHHCNLNYTWYFLLIVKVYILFRMYIVQTCSFFVRAV